MLFLDFLWLFFCIVLLNARPIFKSAANNDIVGDVTDLHKKHINKQGQHEHHDNSCNDNNKQTKLKYYVQRHNPNNEKITRRLANEELNLKDFEILKNIKDNQKYDNLLLPSHKATTGQEYSKMTKIYGYDERSILNNEESTENSNENDYYSVNNNIMDFTTGRSEMIGTAEIEAVLNEIKHRELQMIAQHEPSVTDLISNTVTETTFAAYSHLKTRKMFPGFAISTIMSLDKNNKLIIETTTSSIAKDKMPKHNLYLRSLADNTTTPAQNIENILQKKCKNAYYKLKKKLTNDFNKEVKQTKATIKEKMNTLCNKANKNTTTKIKPSQKLIKNVTSTVRTPKPIKTSRMIHYTRKLKNNKLTTTLHSIPVLSDDYSMLSVFELLLTKSHENNIMNMLSTKTFPVKRQIKTELNEKSRDRIFDYSNQANDYNYKGTTPYEQNDQSDVLEDTSFEGLSNKMSYNDYVNGFKYYLNSQKDPDDLKFSNLIRYQAHKHHKVDDIGKFILNKIPQLSTTRLKRKFVETETLDDQDVSTKSEDSWFKKHFFIFLDKDTPKKFHSLQTITFKDSYTQLNRITKPQNVKNITDSYVAKNHITTPMTPLISKKYNKQNEIKNKNSVLKHTKMEQNHKNNNIEKWSFDEEFRSKRNFNQANGNVNFKSTLNNLKNIGFVDIDLVQVTPVAESPQKNKNKLVKFMLPKFRKSNYKTNKEKRETDSRVPRFNIFKTFKGTYKTQARQTTIKKRIFDYEILKDVNTRGYEFNYNMNNVVFKIDELMKQIPNISMDTTANPFLGSKYDKLSANKLKSEDYYQKLYYSKKPELDHETDNDYFELQDKATSDFSKNKEADLLNVNYKSLFNLNNNYPKVSFVTFPSVFTMTKDGIRKQIGVIRNGIKNVSSDNAKKTSTINHGKSNAKYSENKAKISTKSHHTIASTESLRVANHSRNYIHNMDYSDIFLTPDKINWMMTNSKNDLRASKPTFNNLKGYIPHETQLFSQNSKTSKLRGLHNNKNVMKPDMSNINKIPDRDNRFNDEVKKYKGRTNNKNTFLMADSTIDNILYSNTNITSAPKFDELYLSKFTKSLLTNEKMKPEEKSKNYLSESNPSNAINYIKLKKKQSNKKTRQKISKQKNTLPEQYFKTPVPMQEDEFNNFLREQNIDVVSVTSPLRDTVSKIIDSRNSGSTFVPKLSTTRCVTFAKNINELHDLQTTKYNAQKQHQDNRDIFLMKKMASYDADYIDDKTVNPNSNKFTHLFKEDALKFSILGSPLTNRDQEREHKTPISRSVPKRLRMRGHSFKYDIIINDPNNNRKRDIDYGSGIATIFPNTIKNDEQPKVDESLDRRQRGRKVARNKKIPPNFIGNSRVKYDNWSNLEKKKHGKRDLDDHKCFTAKDVAALEVVVDLMKNTQGLEESEKKNVNFRSNQNISYSTLLQKENQLNSIQIHIAIPPVVGDKKRSLESANNVRKVFSAIMSTPVDLEYQILTFNETTIAPTTVVQNILSPGLYLLVENTNVTCPKGNFALKPLSSIDTSNLSLRHLTSPIPNKTNTKQSTNNTNSFSIDSKVKKNNKNRTIDNQIKCKRDINIMAGKRKNFMRRKKNPINKRNINFNAVKRFFGHDRVCRCHCKVNSPMCKPCAESDKVISELIFEFGNLEKYVSDHCTEIQTFFWMNPTGGKKLRSVIHRIDTFLNDYYKRVKGKCQGRTCQMISSNIDKRSLTIDKTDHPLLKRLLVLFNNLQKISKYHIDSENVFTSGKNSLKAVSNCLTKQIYKRSFSNNDDESPMKSVYSLNNVKINLICSKDLISSTAYLPKDNLFETITEMSLYYDVTGKEKKKLNFFKRFFKKFPYRRKSKKAFKHLNSDSIHSKYQVGYPILPNEEKHSLLNYYDGYKKYKRMSDFYLKPEESVNPLTTSAKWYRQNNNKRQINNGIEENNMLKENEVENNKNENSLKNVSCIRQNIIELFKLSDFMNKRKRNDSVSMNIASTTLVMYGPNLSPKKTKVVSSTATDKNHKLSTNSSSKLNFTSTKSMKLNFTRKISNDLSKNTTLSNIKSTNVKVTNSSSRKDADKITSKSNVFDKLKRFTLKYLKNNDKDTKNNKRNQNYENGVIITTMIPDTYLMQKNVGESEFTSNITQMNPTIIIFDDITCTTNKNQQCLDINCILVKNDMSDTMKTNDERTLLKSNNTYKSIYNVLNDIQSKSLNQLDSQTSNQGTTLSVTSSFDHYDRDQSNQDTTAPVTSSDNHYNTIQSIQDTKVSGTSTGGHYDRHHSIRDTTVSGTSTYGFYDKLRSLKCTRKSQSPNDRSTVKETKGLIDKIAEKFVIKIVPNKKILVKTNKGTSTDKLGSEQATKHKESHLKSKIHRLGQSKLSTPASVSSKSQTKDKSKTKLIKPTPSAASSTRKMTSIELNVN